MIKNRTILLSLVITILFSWIILPFFIPPFRAYSIHELVEVIFWQVIGLVGWPLALPGMTLTFLLDGELRDLGNIFLLLIYPGMLLLLIRVILFKPNRRWEVFLLYALLTISFAAVWYRVLNGYVFMEG